MYFSIVDKTANEHLIFFYARRRVVLVNYKHRRVPMSRHVHAVLLSVYRACELTVPRFRQEFRGDLNYGGY